MASIWRAGSCGSRITRIKSPFTWRWKAFDSWEVQSVWEQEGASTGPQIFPRHYLAPRKFCEDDSENFVGPRKNNRTALVGTKNSRWGRWGSVSIKKATALPTVGRRTGNRSNPTRGFDKKTVSLVTRFRRGFMASKHRADSRSSCRVACFFFGTFFFQAKKKVVRSPWKRKKSYEKSRLRTEKKYSFYP